MQTHLQANQQNKPNPELAFKPKPEFENDADATGLWFAAVVVFAFLVAGIIVYRSGNPDYDALPNGTMNMAAAQAQPSDVMPPLHVHIEGVDP